jgi:hypothetical protein
VDQQKLVTFFQQVTGLHRVVLSRLSESSNGFQDREWSCDLTDRVVCLVAANNPALTDLQITRCGGNLHSWCVSDVVSVVQGFETPGAGCFQPPELRGPAGDLLGAECAPPSVYYIPPLLHSGVCLADRCAVPLSTGAAGGEVPIGADG